MTLAEKHWKYVEGILCFHEVDPEHIVIAKEYYLSSFIHGYKHGREDGEIKE